MVLGVTGGSGCGKSEFCRTLGELGAFVIDADIIAREVVEAKKPALLEIKEAFGADYILPNGGLDRKKMGTLVFSNPEKLNTLNAVTHKYIIEEIKNNLKGSAAKIKIIDAAVLFESGLADICDRTLAVIADKSVREARIIKRDNLEQDMAEKRINAQQNDDYYRANADDIIVNNGTKEELYIIAKKYFEKLENLF